MIKEIKVKQFFLNLSESQCYPTTGVTLTHIIPSHLCLDVLQNIRKIVSSSRVFSEQH